jgi:hypothetical protein
MLSCANVWEGKSIILGSVIEDLMPQVEKRPPSYNQGFGCNRDDRRTSIDDLRLLTAFGH